MALSSSESALLTQTCENMNIAANTCREVLEMLRNLGNTGVVDIATHNNTPGAHATDNTIMHVSTSGNTYIYKFKSGDSASYLDLWSSSDGINMYGVAKTLGAALSGYSGNQKTQDLILTDSNGNQLAFNTETTTVSHAALGFDSYKIKDISNNMCGAGIRYYAGRSALFGDSVHINAYGEIGFMASTGAYNTLNDIACLNITAFYPCTSNTISLGWSGAAWKDIYTVNAVTVTSDRRAKKDITSIGSQAVDFIKALRPVSYRLKQGEGHIDPVDEYGNPIEVETPPVDREGIRTHWGFIAQEVKEALSTAGYEDAAVWCLADKDDPDSRQSLRYEELIAPMIKAIQQQQERIEALERKVA